MKKVAIVGMATTSRHLAPFDDPDFEIWGLNESYYAGHKNPQGEAYMQRWTRWFQMHPKWDYGRPHNFNHKNHKLWLWNAPWSPEELEKGEDYIERKAYGADENNRRRTDFPIYMLEYDPDVPGSTVYPFDDIIKDFGVNSENVKWFTNSFGYMVAMAIHLGAPEIHYYGFEMSSEEEYGHQRPNAAFWNGIAVGRGIKLVEPEGCRLLGQYDQLYGYEKVPGITKMHLEIERNMYKKEVEKKQAELNNIIGEKTRVDQEMKAAIKTKQKGRIARSKKELEELLNRQVRAHIELGSMSAALQVVEKHMRDLDGVPSAESIKLIPFPGKIQVT